jgi:two-component system, response regulator YesN
MKCWFSILLLYSVKRGVGMYKVLIVDDEALIREGIAEGLEWSLLECEPPYLAENGLEAVKLISAIPVDIVITDIKMPGMNGIELAQWISENSRCTRVMILTGYDDFKYAQSALRFGVLDFLLKPTKLEEIRESILKIRRKLEEEGEKQQVYKESIEIIEKNQTQEKRQLLNSLIFKRIENVQELRQRIDEESFNPYLQTVAVMELKNQPDKLFHEDNSMLYYIEHMENLISDKIRNTSCKFVSQFERDCLILFFYSENKSEDKASFSRSVDEILRELERDMCGYVPFEISIGISEASDSIFNARNMYYEALKKCDAHKKKKYWYDGLETEDGVDVSGIVSPNYSQLVSKKDIQGINDEVEMFFRKLRENTAVHIKSAAIEFINYTLWMISKNYITKSIGKEKVYSRIINAADGKEIEHIVKETLRRICISMDIFLDNSESGELEERIISYIRAHFYSDLTLEEVAARFYMSPGHMGRILKKSCGKTFIDILNMIRIENAKMLLRNPRFKAYEVAEAVGFNDAKYFSQVFKKYTGKTPSEFK